MKRLYGTFLLLTTLASCQEQQQETQVKEYTYLFWTSLDEGAIMRAVVEDENIQIDTLYKHRDSAPCGITVDANNEVIYWTDFATKRIFRAEWNGNSLPETLYITPEAAEGPLEIVLDYINHEIYWTHPYDNMILHASASGNGGIDTLANESNGLNGPWGIELDHLTGYLYWVEYLDVEVWRTSLSNVFSPERLYAGGSGFLKPFGVCMNGFSNDLLIVDNSVPGAGLSDRILRGGLSGADPLRSVYTLNEGVSNAYSAKVDADTGDLYWMNQLSDGSIFKGHVDGIVPPVKFIDGIHAGYGLALAKVKRIKVNLQ